MKKIVRILLAAVLSVSAFAFTACGKKDGDGTAATREALKAEFLAAANGVTVAETSVTFKDASDAESVTVQKNPGNVMNLYASFTTLWYEAGGTAAGVIGGAASIELYNEYIGRDITKDPGVWVAATSSSAKNWSPENIIAKQPQLIICSTAMSGYSTISGPAAAANIPVIAVDYNDFSDYLKWFKVFSNLSGHPELYESVALAALEEVLDVIMKVPADNRPVVFSMFKGTNSLEANTSGTVVGAMAKQLGATNIADSWQNDAGADRLPINLESVLDAAPACILVQCHDADEVTTALIQTTYGDNPVWNALDAVKNNKVYYLPKTLFHNKPNRKFAEAYKLMAQKLYPGVNFDE
ncbi:MAG: ABC transporter substrate-binding protein [Clostridiales bacterium]|jgi:ABC-type Fe3+-hydroxamate transport system substrate-binding protein|nr:ABC transporter substrate-binding protein [Clostridiales bacterium]